MVCNGAEWSQWCSHKHTHTPVGSFLSGLLCPPVPQPPLSAPYSYHFLVLSEGCSKPHPASLPYSVALRNRAHAWDQGGWVQVPGHHLLLLAEWPRPADPIFSLAHHQIDCELGWEDERRFYDPTCKMFGPVPKDGGMLGKQAPSPPIPSHFCSQRLIPAFQGTRESS